MWTQILPYKPLARPGGVFQESRADCEQHYLSVLKKKLFHKMCSSTKRRQQPNHAHVPTANQKPGPWFSRPRNYKAKQRHAQRLTLQLSHVRATKCQFLAALYAARARQNHPPTSVWQTSSLLLGAPNTMRDNQAETGNVSGCHLRCLVLSTVERIPITFYFCTRGGNGRSSRNSCDARCIAHAPLPSSPRMPST